jgi:hypothetical protein
MYVDIYGALKSFNPSDLRELGPAETIYDAQSTMPHAMAPSAGTNDIDFNEREIGLAVYNPESGWVRFLIFASPRLPDEILIPHLAQII